MIKKLNAFTIVEVIVVMVITSIVVMTLFTSYLLIKKQYVVQSGRSQKLNQYVLLKRTFAADFHKADSVKYDSLSASVFCYSGNAPVIYKVSDTGIARHAGEIYDNFDIRINDLIMGYCENSVLVNAVSFNGVAYNDTVRTILIKQYDAKTMLSSIR